MVLRGSPGTNGGDRACPALLRNRVDEFLQKVCQRLTPSRTCVGSRVGSCVGSAPAWAVSRCCGMYARAARGVLRVRGMGTRVAWPRGLVRAERVPRRQYAAFVSFPRVRLGQALGVSRSSRNLRERGLGFPRASSAGRNWGSAGARRALLNFRSVSSAGAIQGGVLVSSCKVGLQVGSDCMNRKL